MDPGIQKMSCITLYTHARKGRYKVMGTCLLIIYLCHCHRLGSPSAASSPYCWLSSQPTHTEVIYFPFEILWPFLLLNFIQIYSDYFLPVTEVDSSTMYFFPLCPQWMQGNHDLHVAAILSAFSKYSISTTGKSPAYFFISNISLLKILKIQWRRNLLI